MIPNLMEDYFLHIQRHESVELGVLKLAVPSHVESVCMYTHNGMLEDNVYHKAWSREPSKFLNEGNEDIVSLFNQLLRRVTIDVEDFSVDSERAIDFIHHDGEMYEIIPSSNPDSPPIEQDNYTDVKQDITKKRKTVLACSGHIEFTADSNCSDGHALYCENGLSVNILSNTVSHQLPKVAHLCRCFTPKAVCDPFVNSLSGLPNDETYILRNEKVIYPEFKLSDGLPTISLSNRQQGNRWDFGIEEALLISNTLMRSYSEGLDHDVVNGQHQDDKHDKFLDHDSTCDILPTGPQQNIECLKRSPVDEPAFMELNTEGLTESECETVCSLECACIRQQSVLAETIQGDYQLTKWDIHHIEQLMKFNPNTAECTEMQALETEKHFMQTLALRLQIPNLKEKPAHQSNAVLLATDILHNTFQVRHNKLDLTLPWDPVGKSSHVINTCNLCIESFSDCDDKLADDDYLHCTHENLQKFILDNSFYDELKSPILMTWGKAACSSPISTCMSLSSADDNNKNNIKSKTIHCEEISVTGSTNEMKDEQKTGNSLEDFLLLRMGYLMKTDTPKKDDKLLSMPTADVSHQSSNEVSSREYKLTAGIQNPCSEPFPCKSDAEHNTTISVRNIDLKGQKCNVGETALKLIGSQRITQASDLLLHLESRHNILILERNFNELYQDNVICTQDPPQYADISVDERTGIVLEDVCQLCDCGVVESLIKRLAKLSLQYCHCWVILQREHNNQSVYPYGGQTVNNLAFLQASISEITRKTNEFSLKVLYSDSDSATAKLIHHIAEKASQSTTSWNKNDWLQRSWLKLQLSQHEKMLMRFPCMNPFTAQLMLTTAHLNHLLAMPLPSLIKRCPWIPHKILKIFVGLSRGIPLAGLVNAGNISAISEPGNQDDTNSYEHMLEHCKCSTSDKIQPDEPIPCKQKMCINHDINNHQASIQDTNNEEMTLDNKMVIKQEEYNNPSCHWDNSSQSCMYSISPDTKQSSIIPHCTTDHSTDYIAKMEDNTILTCPYDKSPTEYYNDQDSVELSRSCELNRTHHYQMIKTDYNYIPMEQHAQNPAQGYHDSVSLDDKTSHDVCSSNWIQSTYTNQSMMTNSHYNHHKTESELQDTKFEFENTELYGHLEGTYCQSMRNVHMHQHVGSEQHYYRDKDLESGLISEEDLDVPVDKRMRLTYERVPGSRDGQTKLTFI